MKNNFLIVDGNSLMHRAFHALPLMDSGGTYTNAIYGFLSMLLKAISAEQIGFLAICFDEHAPTFRHTLYPEYKAGRKETPPELRQQFDTILPMLDEMGIARFSLVGWEADDLLGTLARKSELSGLSPILLTGDRDALQLVNDNTRVLFTKKGISDAVVFSPDKVKEEFGIAPCQVTDWKGLAGDASDNIKGVPGVGDKTAVKLLQEYESLEKVLENASKLKGKLGDKIADNAEQAMFSKKLATIRSDAPVDFDAEKCRFPGYDSWIPSLKKFRLFSLINRIKCDGFEMADTQDEAPALLPFSDEHAVADIEELHRWLENALKPVTLYRDESAVSLTDAGGSSVRVSFGGDLFTPGLVPDEVLTEIAALCRDHPAAVHDAKDWMRLFDGYGIKPPTEYAWDTALAQYLINPQEKDYGFHSLFPDMPADARGVCSVHSFQKHKMDDSAKNLLTKLEIPLSAVLFGMEKAGFRIDTELLRGLGREYASEMEEKKREVFRACGCGEFNLNSPSQLGEVLFDKLNLPHGKKTAKGYSTSAEVLEDIRNYAPQIIEPLLRFRQLSKLNGTYVEGMLPLVDAQGRIHTRFDQVSTATGRISSSEPNLQNIPVRTVEGREIRRAFLPEKGWVLIDADYSQIELRLMAHFSGDEALVNAFRSGRDVHTLTAAAVFGLPPEQVTQELRSKAKAVNFGLIYGISEFGLSKNTGITRKEAGRFIDAYFEKYPGVKRYMTQAVENGFRKGYTETLFGRKRPLPEMHSSNAQVREFGKRAAMNTPIQGTAADLIKMAMVKVSGRLSEKKLRARLILQVHDELIIECPPEEKDIVSNLLCDTMENVFELSVPLTAEVHCGHSWEEAKQG